VKKAAAKGEGRILTPYELKELRGDSWVREAVVLQNQTKTEAPLAVDEVVSMLGYISKLGPLAEWGLALHDRQIQVGMGMETSMPGIFACGDVAYYEGKVKVIAIGFGEAAIAANYAAHYVNPELSVTPGHSSDIQRRL